MERGVCLHCHVNPIVGRKRKYCDVHSRQASAFWKRRDRRERKDRGEPRWDGFKTDEERQAYHRRYKREYRRRKPERRAA